MSARVRMIDRALVLRYSILGKQSPN